jgi:hypothetical protein
VTEEKAVNEVLEQVLGDLTAEGDALEQAVLPLDEQGWRTPVPAEGWDIATTIVHLAWTDEAALAAGTDKEAWDALVMAAIGDPVRRQHRLRGREGAGHRDPGALAGRAARAGVDAA